MWLSSHFSLVSGSLWRYITVFIWSVKFFVLPTVCVSLRSVRASSIVPFLVIYLEYRRNHKNITCITRKLLEQLLLGYAIDRHDRTRTRAARVCSFVGAIRWRMNTVRRPVAAASTVWFGKQLTSSNKIGISLACLGSLLYSLAQMSRKAK